MCVRMHVCVYVCAYVCVGMHVCAYACVRMHVCVCMCAYACVGMYVCVCMYVFVIRSIDSIHLGLSISKIHKIANNLCLIFIYVMFSIFAELNTKKNLVCTRMNNNFIANTDINIQTNNK